MAFFRNWMKKRRVQMNSATNYPPSFEPTEKNEKTEDFR